ncbi:DNA-binding response regulator [Methylotenera oryzisoli]|uniref:DNA-binding response regulator n=1 Tax=Methylotenera oryzisoli TaxID=2080758 RepID=A0A4Y9VU62_9PROT|nr:LytTR family DNA-binding domain-containing protein [Methylotenera oryzisoli]TFW72217.1 DNA-binding response regulator [Methylotenera oryzisoli]
MPNHTHLNIVIADDEAPARNRLRSLLGDIENTQVLAEAKNGKELLEIINQAYDTQTAANIVLLDIRMPEMDGIEAAQHLQKLPKPPAVIFTTAYDNYAIQAFDISAVDYLLKPIRLERLQTALQKARALLPSQLETLTPLSPKRTHLSINERGRILLVPISDVIYLRAELKYITVRTAEREYLIEESLSHLEQEFSHIFTRLHRNCLAANAYILGYEKRHHDEHAEKQWVALLKHVPETISVSRRQQHLIRQTILN